MPCLGNVKESIVKHARNTDPDAVLVFNRTEAHSSHTMASAPALRIHFCVACGCYAGSRSKGLKQPCSRFPKKAGKEALAAIALGKQPNAAAYALYRRLGKGAWVSRYSKGNGLACSKLLGLTTQAQPLPPHSLDGAAASGSIQKQVTDLVSSLCRPVPECSLGDSSLLKAEGDLERRNSAEDTLISGRSFGDSSLLEAEGDLDQRNSTAGSILSKVMETGVADNLTEVVYHKDLLQPLAASRFG